MISEVLRRPARRIEVGRLIRTILISMDTGTIPAITRIRIAVTLTLVTEAAMMQTTSRKLILKV